MSNRRTVVGISLSVVAMFFVGVGCESADEPGGGSDPGSSAEPGESIPDRMVEMKVQPDRAESAGESERSTETKASGGSTSEAASDGKKPEGAKKKRDKKVAENAGLVGAYEAEKAEAKERAASKSVSDETIVSELGGAESAGRGSGGLGAEVGPESATGAAEAAEGGGEAIGSLGALEGGEKAAGLGLSGEGGDGGGEKKMARGAAESGAAKAAAAAPGTKRRRARGDGTADSQQRRAGRLTAGRWNDLEEWDFWRDLFERGSSETEGENVEGQGDEGRSRDWTHVEEKWGFRTRRLVPVRVTTDGEPAVDVPVELVDSDGETLWSARTDNEGRAYLFDGIYGDPSHGADELLVGTGENRHTVDGVDPRRRPYTVELEEVDSPPAAVDLMFTVDTTGSMSDELDYLNAELQDVVQRARRRLDREVSLRISANFYRDRQDRYVVRSNSFTTDVGGVVEQIGGQAADGGGDKPEAVDRALAASVDQHEWRERAAARLLFLVLDAPPHDDAKFLRKVRETIRRAAAKGIRVVPVVGSGIGKETEFLMRFMEIATGGTYVFLTDHSGIGGSHIEPTIGDYDVRKLNELLADVIVSYARE